MIKFIVVDLFCGGGGVTEGIEMAMLDGKKCCKVIAAVNHDPIAIKSHSANHKEVLHLTEDIRLLSNIPILERHIAKSKEKYPGAKVALWASLECTNFSNAKNGHRDRDSRTLAWDFFKYVQVLCPDVVMIENVREFMSWGDLDDRGRPVDRKKGRDYVKWCNAVQDLGYNFDWRLINCADLGVPQTRIRYFANFSRPGIMIKWPEQTHQKAGKANGFIDQLNTWEPVKKYLDLNIIGGDIFKRKKPYSENTLRRIYAGLQKFIATGDKQWIVKYFNKSDGTPNNGISVDQPCATVTTQQRLNLAFVVKNNSGHDDSKCVSLGFPTGTLTTKCHQSIVHAAFIQKYYNGSDGVTSMDAPAGTVTTKDRFSAVWIEKQYGTGVPRSALSPASTVLSNDKQRLVSVILWDGQYGNKGRSLDQPANTVIASQHKSPLSVISVSLNHLPIIINDNDSKYTKLIKAFMIEYGISAIFMRPLNIKELLRIQGFRDNYILYGTQSRQKKHIGNAVPPIVSQKIFEAISRVN